MERSLFPFTLHGREGSVTVEYGPNDDPERWGYGILGLPWPARLAERLPVLTANSVEQARSLSTTDDRIRWDGSRW
jgi:hypothetical protein